MSIEEDMGVWMGGWNFGGSARAAVEARERVGGCGMGSGSGLVVVVSLCAGDHGASFGGGFVVIRAVLSEISVFIWGVRFLGFFEKKILWREARERVGGTGDRVAVVEWLW
jgi:hypothetical protein